MGGVTSDIKLRVTKSTKNMANRLSSKGEELQQHEVVGEIVLQGVSMIRSDPEGST